MAVKKKAICFLLLASLLILGCNLFSSTGNQALAEQAMVVSVSSDGKYAVSSHLDNRIVFWDLELQEKKIISENANIYSAYFIRKSQKFIWQDLDNVVFVQDVNGKVDTLFTHEPVYGHLMTSDFRKYFSSDISWAIHALKEDGPFITVKEGDGQSFLGFGKLLNLELSSNEKLLLMSGYGYEFENKYTLEQEKNERRNYKKMVGTTVWNAATLEPLFKLPGNSAKTTATFSPDSKFVVGGCENGLGFAWRTDTGAEVHRLASLFHGIWTMDTSDNPDKWYDKTGLIPTPSDLNSNEAILAIRFIDAEHYLCFLTYSPYAVLYHIDSPLPLKYLYLGRDPLPAVRDYHRNAAMDTAPEAGILVMGQQYGGGIIVYKYDSETQELDKMWEADR